MKKITPIILVLIFVLVTPVFGIEAVQMSGEAPGNIIVLEKPEGYNQTVGEEYTFIVKAIDPQGDQVSFQWNWVNSQNPDDWSDWSDYDDHNTPQTFKHTWNYYQEQKIFARARDDNNPENIGPWTLIGVYNFPRTREAAQQAPSQQGLLLTMIETLTATTSQSSSCLEAETPVVAESSSLNAETVISTSE